MWLATNKHVSGAPLKGALLDFFCVFPRSYPVPQFDASNETKDDQDHIGVQQPWIQSHLKVHGMLTLISCDRPTIAMVKLYPLVPPLSSQIIWRPFQIFPEIKAAWMIPGSLEK